MGLKLNFFGNIYMGLKLLKTLTQLLSLQWYAYAFAPRRSLFFGQRETTV